MNDQSFGRSGRPTKLGKRYRACKRGSTRNASIQRTNVAPFSCEGAFCNTGADRPKATCSKSSAVGGAASDEKLRIAEVSIAPATAPARAHGRSKDSDGLKV